MELLREWMRSIRVKSDTPRRDQLLARLVVVFGEAAKAEVWLKAPNPLLKDRTPESFISDGRSKQIDKLLDERYQ